MAAPAGNDDFANAQTLSGSLPIVVTATVDEATREPGEPYVGYSTVWYRWTAPENRDVAIESCGGDSYQPLVRVYTGSSVADLNRVRSSDEQDNRAKCPLPNPDHDDPTDTYRVVGFKAVAGTTYRIQVAPSSYGKIGIVLRPAEVYDVALSQSVSRRTVPFGGSLTEVLTVTNRGNIAVPVPSDSRLAFGQEINRPGLETYVGKAVYASIRSPGGHCRHGLYGYGSKLQVASCRVTPLAPGESQRARIRIKKIKGNLLLDAHIFVDYSYGGDARKGNNDAQTVIRVRR
jgi:hypothetical protein